MYKNYNTFDRKNNDERKKDKNILRKKSRKTEKN